MRKKGKEGKLIFCGEKGESVFIKPFIDFSLIEENTEHIQIYKKMEKSGDDRSFAIVTALVLEYHIDKFFQTWIPDYSRLSERRDFTPSLKIDWIVASRLIPLHILKCADCIRSVRNDFAHNLDLDSLGNIKKGRVDKLKMLYEEIYGNSSGKSVRELFDKVAFVAISGISAYRSNILALQELIQSEQVIEELEHKSMTKFNKKIEEIMRKGPEEIKTQDGLKIERFDKGVVKVTAINKEKSEQ